MKKILYITDREEYTEHNFIGPLFEKYLPELMDVDIVYLTKYKSDFEDRNGRFIVPIHEKNDILKYLSENEIDVFKYDFVIVRNMYKILDNILSLRGTYDIKVGYRLSFPKLALKLEQARAENKSNILLKIEKKIRTYTRTKLINRCDIFLPTSKELKDIYCPNVTTKTHIIPSGIDPDNIRTKVKRGDDKIKFVYSGSLSKIRKFKIVIKAFNELKHDNWKLYIFTSDKKIAQKYLNEYSSIKERVRITKAESRDELLALMTNCDIGLSLQPNIDLFNTSINIKTVEYYTAAIPVLMTNSDKSREIFSDCTDALLCEFDKDSIVKKLNKIMETSKDQIRKMGEAGQAKLLEKRDYREITSKFAEALRSL
jgi:glycosyltransferase involved in cell wall biosynthesis